MARMQQWRITIVLSLLLLTSPILATLELSEEVERLRDEEYISVEEEIGEELQRPDVFVPSRDWKVVKEGQHIPPGLHIRMNLQTGLKEAKLLDNTESEGAGSPNLSTRTFRGDTRRRHHYGESDRRGVVNKRTKVFSAAEVTNMLEDVNSDSIDFEHLPQIAAINAQDASQDTTNTQDTSRDSSVTTNTQDTGVMNAQDTSMGSTQDNGPGESTLPQKSDTGPEEHTEPPKRTQLPLSVHRDVEEMLALSGVLANKSSTVEELCHALEELEFYVHQMNNAKDLDVIGGLVLVVRLLNHTQPDVKSWAARVIGSASQSNPPVQELALSYGSLPLLCQLITASEPDMVQRRALFALSALLRGNPRQQLEFIKKHHGLKVLGSSFEERSAQVQVKAVVLLTDLLNEELTTSTTNADHMYMELPILLYSEVLNSDWCSHVTRLIQIDQPVTLEKGLLAMRALTSTCNFTAVSARLAVLVRQFGSSQLDLDTEYTEHLLEHCRALLRDIRQRNNIDL